jgi:hypothetical protein
LISAEEPELGSTLWKLYSGEEGQFGAETQLALPLELSSYNEEFVPIYGLYGEGDCDTTGEHRYSFAVFDLTGDRLLELVPGFLP